MLVVNDPNLVLFTTTNVEVFVAVCAKSKFTSAVVPETVNDSNITSSTN